MAIRTAQAKWNGNLVDGNGSVKTGSGILDAKYSFGSRFEEAQGTNPEELIGAAHAGCFSMALAAGLAAAGHKPEWVETDAKVHIDKSGDGFAITLIELSSRAHVPGLDDAAFQKFAQDTKSGCPVSKALASVDIKLTAVLV